jgi:cellulose synthase/poly-beta-1,6-N-acetylglucosamine synthase-like glycosyltransferase
MMSILWLGSFAVLAMVAVVSIELVAAWRWRRPAATWSMVRSSMRSPRVAVLMPAHNEEDAIWETLGSLLPMMGDGDRVLVVADNCSDGTAEAARALGADVVERSCLAERGKGYALEFGRLHLAHDPPDVVIVLDADCRIERGSIRGLARAALACGGPVQAVYVMDPPAPATPIDAVSVFAICVKNHLRPLGLAYLGGPCLLVGSGMAIPWSLFAGARLDCGNVVEDLQMGVDLAVGGAPAHLCREVEVRSVLPSGRSAAVTQRTRWEHGHLRLILTQAPRLVWAGIRQRRPALAVLGAELAVPPLSLLILAVCCAVLASSVAAAAWGHIGPLAASSAAVVLLAGAIGLHWRVWRAPGMRIGPVSVARYVLMKVPIYLRFMVARQREWVRTPRTRATLEEPAGSPREAGAAP